MSLADRALSTDPRDGLLLGLASDTAGARLRVQSFRYALVR